MNKQNFISRAALFAAIVLCPLSNKAIAGYAPPVGGFASDGSVFVGFSGLTQTNIYTTSDDAPNLMTWDDAKSYCGGLHDGSHTDWRLPDSYELTLMYQHRKAGALNGTFNKTGGPAGWYWSSSEEGGSQVSVRRFTTGDENIDYKDDKSSVRCVRGAE